MNSTEKYILDALVILMGEKDYSSITVMDIVGKAGVSRVSYYRHFKNKEDVLRLYFANQIEKFKQNMPYIMRSREDFFEAIFAAFKQFSVLSQDNLEKKIVRIPEENRQEEKLKTI